MLRVYLYNHEIVNIHPSPPVHGLIIKGTCSLAIYSATQKKKKGLVIIITIVLVNQNIVAIDNGGMLQMSEQMNGLIMHSYIALHGKVITFSNEAITCSLICNCSYVPPERERFF